MEKSTFQKILLTWYKGNKRPLPWRLTKDPYRIWLSEIILQQTRISQGLPYYLKFIKAYENIHALAEASEAEVLRHWQGLGYYSRARNMLKCAKLIVDRYEGQFPDKEQDLLKLPGIGKYTTAAIASISFERPVPVIDGNVYRVLSRIFGIMEDIQTSEAQKKFQKLAEELIPDKKPGDYNQAIMEFGALFCKPRNPACKQCLFSAHCFANISGKQNELPSISPKIKPRERYFHYWVIRYEDLLFMKKRNNKDIWQGLYDFPLIETQNQGFDFSRDKMTNYLVKNYPLKNTRTFRHILTHQVICATFYHCPVDSLDEEMLNLLPEEGGFRTPEETERLPKPGLIDKYLKEE
ncbi:MAG: A/G-specific adenine glycosylase [Cyclobacteriaceae bacterium]|nr:A/G-specific adenine glycosylase [Cyclobacteriaceae bacterium]